MHDSEPIISGDSGISSSQTSVNKKPFIIAGAAVTLLALFALLFFLVIFPKLKPAEPEEKDDVVELIIEDEDVTEYETADDYLAELEHLATEGETPEARLTARLNTVSFLVSLEEYEQAEAKMAEISTEGFNTNDFYRYYNVYSRIYDEGRNLEKYNEYRSLATQYLNKLQDENFDQIMNAASQE